GGVQYDPERKIKDMVIPAGTEKAVRVFKPFAAASVQTQSAKDSYEWVLAFAGASVPKRDPVDVRVIESVRSGKTTTKTGIIDTPADVGGWPKYHADKVPLDADGDGIPDDWEIRYGLNPRDPADASQSKTPGGYTYLEHYLNGTDPTAAVDYANPKNNVNPHHNFKTQEPRR